MNKETLIQILEEEIEELESLSSDTRDRIESDILFYQRESYKRMIKALKDESK